MKRPNIVLENIQPDNFIASASYECMTEVQLGLLAVKKGDAEPVRNFAHHLILDYDKTSSDIARIATRKKLRVPDSLDEEHRNIVEQLRRRAAGILILPTPAEWWTVNSGQSPCSSAVSGSRIRRFPPWRAGH